LSPLKNNIMSTVYLILKSSGCSGILRRESFILSRKSSSRRGASEAAETANLNVKIRPPRSQTPAKPKAPPSAAIVAGERSGDTKNSFLPEFKTRANSDQESSPLLVINLSMRLCGLESWRHFNSAARPRAAKESRSADTALSFSSAASPCICLCRGKIRVPSMPGSGPSRRKSRCSLSWRKSTAEHIPSPGRTGKWKARSSAPRQSGTSGSESQSCSAPFRARELGTSW